MVADTDDTLRDVCRDPECPTCSLWPREGETHDAWLERLKATYRNRYPRKARVRP